MFGLNPSFPPRSLVPLVEEVAELLKGRNETVSVAETVRISFILREIPSLGRSCDLFSYLIRYLFYTLRRHPCLLMVMWSFSSPPYTHHSLQRVLDWKVGYAKVLIRCAGCRRDNLGCIAEHTGCEQVLQGGIDGMWVSFCGWFLREEWRGMEEREEDVGDLEIES